MPSVCLVYFSTKGSFSPALWSLQVTMKTDKSDTKSKYFRIFGQQKFIIKIWLQKVFIVQASSNLPSLLCCAGFSWMLDFTSKADKTSPCLDSSCQRRQNRKTVKWPICKYTGRQEDVVTTFLLHKFTHRQIKQSLHLNYTFSILCWKQMNKYSLCTDPRPVFLI